MRRRSLFTLVALVTASGSGCTSETDREIRAARRFDRFPLYWAGTRFEKWNVEGIDGLDYNAEFVTFTYGDCEPTDGDGPSCVPPIEIQISPLCDHLREVTAAPIWKTRRIRGAPVGSSDNAPVLFTTGAQVKVYTGEGADPGAAFRLLRRLRSLNRVSPVIGQHGRIPAPPASMLDGSKPCGN